MDSWYVDMPNGNPIPQVTTDAVVTHATIEDQIKEDIQKHSEMDPEGLLHLIIRSVEKKQRHISASGRKRKRRNLKRVEKDRSDGDEESKAYSRFSTSLLVKVLDRVRTIPQYVLLVNWLGFGHILELDVSSIPRSFVQWVAESVNTKEEMIKIGSKSILLTPHSVTETLGTPCGELLVESDELLGKAAYLQVFGISDVPSIKELAEMILQEVILPDAVFCRCFMSVLLGTFLCPNSSTKVSTKYMGSLVDVDKIRDRDWSGFIHKWLLSYIQKYLDNLAKGQSQSLTLGGCIYHLAVRCLDFVDFGSIQMPNTFPRIKVWKGKLIRVCSDMFLGTDGKYGAFPIKDLNETCYGMQSNHEPQLIMTETVLHQSIAHSIGDLVGTELKENIASSYASLMKNESTNVCKKTEELILRVMKAFLSERVDSRETEKLPSSGMYGSHGSQKECNSGQCSYKTAKESMSRTSLPVANDNAFEDDIDVDALVTRKRIRIHNNTSSVVDSGCLVVEKSEVDLPKQLNVIDEAQHSTSRQQMKTANLHEGTAESEAILSQQGQGFQEVQVIISNQEMNPATVHELQKQAECSLGHVNSASFKFMVPNNLSSHKDTCSDGVCSKEQNASTSIASGNSQSSSLDLNKQTKGFSKFFGTESEKEEDKASDQRKIHISKSTQNVITITNDEKLGCKYDSSQQKRSVILELARSKYYFNGTDTPSWRLLENEDDNGRTIDEPEFFRPIGMDDFTYNEKCEEAINRCKDAENKLYGNVMETPEPTKQVNDKNKAVADEQVNVCDTSVHCAQYVPRATGLTLSPERPIDQKDHYVDLCTPDAPVMSQEQQNYMLSMSSDLKTSEDRISLLHGRRLFESGSSNHKDKFSTPKSMVNLISDEESPEIKFIGEKMKSGLAIKEKYSEIQFLGENKQTHLFTRQQSCQPGFHPVNVLRGETNIMSSQVDHMYNNNLSLHTSSSSHAKENFVEKRVTNRSKYLCSPFDTHTQETYTPQQQKIWKAVIALGDSSENTKWAVKMDNIRVSWYQLGNSFKLDGWVHSWVINIFCRILFRREHPRSSMKHYFFNTVTDYWLAKWTTEEGRVHMKKKATDSFDYANKAKSLRQSDGLFFPTVYADHWFVFNVDIKYRHFIFLDSYYGKESNYHKKIDNQLIAQFQQTWVDAGLRPLEFNTYGRAYPNVPQQKNGNDCGIYGMKLLERYDPRDASKYNFSHSDIPAMRIKYANDIVMSDFNTEDDRKFEAACFYQMQTNGEN